jgi:hypothetical protein
VSSWPRARKRIPRQSARTRREQPIRDRVRDETIELAAGMCQARGLLPGTDCAYFLHDREGNPTGSVHEVIKRSRRPGAHLDVSLTLYICAAHDDVILRDEPLGRSVGLCFNSWELDEARAAVVAIREARRP